MALRRPVLEQHPERQTALLGPATATDRAVPVVVDVVVLVIPSPSGSV